MPTPALLSALLSWPRAHSAMPHPLEVRTVQPRPCPHCSPQEDRRLQRHPVKMLGCSLVQSLAAFAAVSSAWLQQKLGLVHGSSSLADPCARLDCTSRVAVTNTEFGTSVAAMASVPFQGGLANRNALFFLCFRVCLMPHCANPFVDSGQHRPDLRRFIQPPLTGRSQKTLPPPHPSHMAPLWNKQPAAMQQPAYHNSKRPLSSSLGSRAPTAQMAAIVKLMPSC